MVKKKTKRNVFVCKTKSSVALFSNSHSQYRMAWPSVSPVSVLSVSFCCSESRPILLMFNSKLNYIY